MSIVSEQTQNVIHKVNRYMINKDRSELDLLTNRTFQKALIEYDAHKDSAHYRVLDTVFREIKRERDLRDKCFYSLKHVFSGFFVGLVLGAATVKLLETPFW